MNKVVIAALCLIAGGFGGYYLGRHQAEEECEERIDEEIESVKTAFRKARAKDKKKQEEEKEEPDEEPEEEKVVVDHGTFPFGSAPKGEKIEQEQKEYREVVNRTSYRKDNPQTEEEFRQQKESMRPRVIDPKIMDANPNEYAEESPITLIYLSDGTLLDSNKNAMCDAEIDEKVGTDFASHFGEYEADSVHIDNPRLKCYFEILRDIRTYDQYLEQEKPYRKGHNY